MEKPLHKTLLFWILLLLIFGLIAGTLYQTVRIKNLTYSLATLKADLSSSRNEFDTFSSSTALGFSKSELKFVELSDLLYLEQNKLEELSNAVSRYNKQVSRLSGSVETLEKLTTTDPELLQKYSRVYFLNEHYKPADLSLLDEKYDLVDGKQISIHSEVLPYLKDLLDNAKEDSINLMVLSGYRSFAEQVTLKESYTVRYGLGANQFSADQGYSEHQLGTTVDFTTAVNGQNLSLFDKSKEHTWLVNNAYKYGFVMSYPENNEYYVYEPWHWRFVGEDLARDLRKKEKFFYDLEQREIDGYIATLFD